MSNDYTAWGVYMCLLVIMMSQLSMCMDMSDMRHSASRINDNIEVFVRSHR